MLRKRDTWAEKLLWRCLRSRKFSNYKFRRQHPFSEHILDFFCIEARLNIELDGALHGLPEQQIRDAERDSELERKGVKVLRFWNSRFHREKEAILSTIWTVLQE